MTIHNTIIRPPLKWVGGKTQLLDALSSRIPEHFNNYIEPFFGGGALFFALQPKHAIIADSNPELINFYCQLVENAELIIQEVIRYPNTSEQFYKLRAQDWTRLDPIVAAARMLFLNRTCFNGLYRVNRHGQFNVPYGKYKSPKLFDRENLLLASKILSCAKIICDDYKQVLRKYAKRNDLVFLDPPYLPISKNADFKRYTKDQFHQSDHIELAEELKRLERKGCQVILTNSNHPSVHEQYARYQIDLIPTKRYVSCRGASRTGEDVIVTLNPNEKFHVNIINPIPAQVSLFPSTRFMGSKSKLLSNILVVTSRLRFDHVTDLFSGSGIVSYFFKACGKTVYSNDYMAMCATFAKAMIKNSTTHLSPRETEKLLTGKPKDTFVSDTFRGIYFSDQDNRLIDVIRTNIRGIKDEFKRAIAMNALIRSCTKKRARGIFTYVGNRYDDGRKDLATPLADHFRAAVEAINNAVFDNGCINRSRMGDAMSFEPQAPSLIYIDPPYYSPFSDNEYVRRYHFVEGLARDWRGVEIQEHTVTKKFKSYYTPFSSKLGASEAFDRLFRKFQDHLLLISYSSNSLPTKDEILTLIGKYKKKVRVVPVAHTYSFGNQGHKIGNNRNMANEYLFIGE